MRLGVFPGTFHPPTRAHLALARAALRAVDEVVFVLPRALPHKEYAGVGFDDRMRLLRLAISTEPRFSVASTSGGLFIEIARELRRSRGAAVELFFLCGRDAAERIVNWDYGGACGISEQLREYQLLVAPRMGVYEPPDALRSRIHALPLASDYDACSATEVRERIARGEGWEELVPENIVEFVREIYRKKGAAGTAPKQE